MTSKLKHYITSIKYPSHTHLPVKSCPDCLRILIMSWLFKDPSAITKEIFSWLFIKDPIVTVALVRFYHIQWNSKKWPKKIKLCRIRLFSKKKLIWRANPKLWRRTIFGPERPNCPESYFHIFFRKTINIISMSLVDAFIVQNCKTIFTTDLDLWECAILDPK